MKNLLKQLPIQILLVILLSIFFGPLLSKGIVGLFYSISCLFKDALMIFLPFVIFSYMFGSMLKFAKSAPILILTVLVTVVTSNALAFLIPYIESQLLMSLFDFSSTSIQLAKPEDTIQCIMQLPVPAFWSPKNGLLVGLILGVILSFVKTDAITQISNFLKNKSTEILNKYFIPLLPLFIFGFFSKLQYEGTVNVLVAGYGKVLCFVFLPIFITYLGFLFLFVNRFNIQKTITHVKDCGSMFITAFSTMSSIATMPLMFKVAEKHVKKDYSDFIIPAVINLHMIGNGLVFATAVVAVSHLFHVPLPSISQLSVFLFYYLLAHFSIAGVPGGACVIIMALTITYLGFSSEMATLFMILGILQDGFITVGNTTGNILYSKFSYDAFGKKILKIN